jgi:hypothetical protein
MLAPQRGPRRDRETALATALRELDPNTLTPLDALTWLAKQRAELLEAENRDDPGGRA